MEKQADPEHELMQLRMAGAWSRPQTVGSGSVPFGCCQAVKRRSECDTKLQTIRPMDALDKDPGPPESK